MGRAVGAVRVSPGAGGVPGPGVQPGSCSPSPGNRGHSARPRSRKTLGDLGGWCAPRDVVAPHSGPQLAPRGVRGEMLPVLSGGRRLPFPGGLGASSLLTGIVQAWRGCLTAGIVQAWRGARCLKTGKEQAPGPFPGARPDRSIVSPSHPGGSSWRKCGGQNTGLTSMVATTTRIHLPLIRIRSPR
jgi:hypothetical protein